MQKISYIFFNKLFPHWSPDIALRYLPVVAILKVDNTIKRVLDVGSGSLGITPYFKKPVVGVDTEFSKPFSPLLARINGSATKLPFKDNSFDAVLCVDVLEHLKPSSRKKAIRELLRVSAKKVVIVVPSGEAAGKEDVFFYEYFKKSTGQIDPFLKEHIEFGLPSDQDIIEILNNNASSVTKKNLTNIYLHRLILIVQFSNNRMMRFVSSVLFILLLPLFRLINFPPVYRRLYLISK